MRKNGCSKQKPRAQWKLKNGDISLSQRCLKMGASTADCIWQKAEPIPELLNPGRSTIMKYRLLGKSGLRVSETSLGTMTFGDGWGWGSPKAEAHFSAKSRFPDLLETLVVRSGWRTCWSRVRCA